MLRPYKNIYFAALETAYFWRGGLRITRPNNNLRLL